MEQLLLHPVTKRRLETLTANLPQSLLLEGPAGVGLGTIATQLAGGRELAILTPTDKAGEPAKEGTIPVESVRDLYMRTRGMQKTAGVVIIDDADRMSQSAQNAFLKLLEEPSSHIHFLLTSHSPEALLPTIHSRVQKLSVLPLAKSATQDLITSLETKDSTRRKQLQFLASGLPAEIIRLQADEAYFKERAMIIADARTFLTADPYNKMLVLHRYQNDRDKAIALLDSSASLLRHTLEASPRSQLIHQLERLIETKERILANGNIKIQLAAFVL